MQAGGNCINGFLECSHKPISTICQKNAYINFFQRKDTSFAREKDSIGQKENLTSITTDKEAVYCESYH